MRFPGLLLLFNAFSSLLYLFVPVTSSQPHWSAPPHSLTLDIPHLVHNTGRHHSHVYLYIPMCICTLYTHAHLQENTERLGYIGEEEFRGIKSIQNVGVTLIFHELVVLGYSFQLGWVAFSSHTQHTPLKPHILWVTRYCSNILSHKPYSWFPTISYYDPQNNGSQEI